MLIYPGLEPAIDGKEVDWIYGDWLMHNEKCEFKCNREHCLLQEWMGCCVGNSSLLVMRTRLSLAHCKRMILDSRMCGFR